MKLRKKICTSKALKIFTLVAILVVNLATSIEAKDTAVKCIKSNVSESGETRCEDIKKSALTIGYDFDLISNRKLVISSPDGKVPFSKAKGFFHGPKLGFTTDLISGFIKIGKANYSFKKPTFGDYKGFGFGFGGKAIFFTQNNFSLAIELAYFGGKATNDKFDFSNLKEYTTSEYVSYSQSENSRPKQFSSAPLRKFVRVPEIHSRTFECPVFDDDGFEMDIKIKGLENGNLVDPYGRVVGFRDDDDYWYANTEFFDVESDEMDNRKTKEFHQDEIDNVKNFGRMKQRMIVARLIAEQKIGNFSPYVGLDYLSDKSTFSEQGASSAIPRNMKIRSQNRTKIGPFIGCNFEKNKKLHFGFEARWVTCHSLSFSSSFCF